MEIKNTSRRIWQIHFSTAIATMFVTAFCLWLNLTPRIMNDHLFFVPAASEIGSVAGYGWPMSWASEFRNVPYKEFPQEYERYKANGAKLSPEFLQALQRQDSFSGFYWITKENLAINVLVMALIVATTTYSVEYILRRKSTAS